MNLISTAGSRFLLGGFCAHLENGAASNIRRDARCISPTENSIANRVLTFDWNPTPPRHHKPLKLPLTSLTRLEFATL